MAWHPFAPQTQRRSLASHSLIFSQFDHRKDGNTLHYPFLRSFEALSRSCKNVILEVVLRVNQSTRSNVPLCKFPATALRSSSPQTAMASVALSSLRPAAPGTPELLYGLNATSLRGSCFPSFPRHDESNGSLSLSIDIPGKREPWRTAASLFPFLKKKNKDTDALKEELLEAIAPLDRGAEATEEDQKRVDQIARELESDNMIKEPLKSDLLNGKWELIYTTSSSILARQRPKLLRPNGKIYQAINSDTLRAQNMETWPFFNQVTANLVPLNARRVAVRFDTFKIAGLVTANLVPLNARCVAVRFDTFKIAHLIPIKAPGRGRGELEITYLDDELRISRGDKGNLFILKMVDRSYRVPT